MKIDSKAMTVIEDEIDEDVLDVCDNSAYTDDVLMSLASKKAILLH